jgi:hypothetical protein
MIQIKALSVSEGRLKAADLEAGLKEHIEQLLNAFNSYTSKIILQLMKILMLHTRICLK